VSFPDLCTHFDVNELADGRRWHEAGFVVPVREGEEPRAAAAVDYRLTWTPGTRWMQSCAIDLRDQSGETHTLTLEPLFHFFMKGLGYTHPDWRHGTWKGELAVGGDRWSTAAAPPDDPTNLHVQTLCRATMGDRAGTGILEQLALGPHQPTGLNGLWDPA